MSDHLSDAKINGDGTVGPGSYGTITLNGAGTITGDVRCHELRVNGAGTCKGAVQADSIVVNGAGTFDGTLQTSELVVNGTADIHAGVGVGRLKCAGTCAIDGGMAAHDLDLRGDLRVGGGVDAKSLRGEGRFNVNGAVTIGDIEFRLHGRNAAASITCDRMILRVPEGIGALFSAFADRRLTAETIVGAELELIDTTARVVRGGNVTLGAGCDIELVEYTGVLQKLAGAQVREERKVASA